jgi:hypothetical protein
MKITVELELEDFNEMHDVIYEVLGIKPTNDQIQNVWDKLPEDIQGNAIQWGTSDTVFRDDLYEWLEENKLVI